MLKTNTVENFNKASFQGSASSGTANSQIPNCSTTEVRMVSNQPLKD